MGFLKHAVVASIAAGLIAPAATNALASPAESPAATDPAPTVPGRTAPALASPALAAPGLAASGSAATGSAASGSAASGSAASGLTVSGLTGPGLAATAAGSLAKPPPKGKLTDALLTDEDLPKGWAAFDAALMGGLLPGALDPNRLGGDPCELPAPPPLKDKVKDAPAPTITPVKGAPPEKAAVAEADKKIKLEFAAFMKGDTGPLLLQTLADTGRKLARRMVDDTREMVKRCPVVKSDTLGIEMSALPRFPAVGDDSQALTMIVTLKDGDYQVSVPGKLVAIADGDVYATVALVGNVEPTVAELKKLTKRALRKLEKSY
ncbi:hypothetical protein [Actinoplanes sp. NPDC023714]|uniref:hypothetical protein n=1 Tax=Actinoplanes sp. NPDC023714 TaxID=3154322 RepID=UPI0033C62224